MIENVKSETSQIIIVGSKVDNKKWRRNKEDELESIIQSRYHYVEISSKDSLNVLYPFFYILYNNCNTILQENESKISSQSNCLLL